ncbi:MAG: M3 family metallopeptidase [Acidobacteria bacterium]|nr:M3 family metallopeptidase [Acidobacteriota bacterium]
MNPLLETWKTPFGLPPFDRIRAEHFVPAFSEAIQAGLKEIDTITGDKSAPTFANTVEALEKQGALLKQVNGVFQNLTSSNTSDALQAAEREVSPKLATYSSAIQLNARLFERLDAVYKQRTSLNLYPEQLRLVERYHRRFVLSGAKLPPEQKKRLAAVDEKLATLTTQFTQNVLNDTKQWTMELKTAEDRAGLPADMTVITLQRPSVEPFLMMSPRRDLREKAFKAWAKRGDNDKEFDNKALIRQILTLRIEKAALLGYKTYADYILDDVMAKTPAAATALMEKVWKPAVAAAHRETAELEAAMRKDGISGPLEAWDWRYYSEKVRLAQYDLNEEQIKPYFELDRMIEAAFDCAKKLFGLQFVRRKNLPVYDPDVRTWEVKGMDGKTIGIFFGDYYSKPNKNSGAWMNVFRDQQKFGGTQIPVVINNLNQNKPAPGQPCLMTFDDVKTLFHEFGHGLHGLLSNVNYPFFAGTSVARDFVELPSQLFEYWGAEKSVLAKFATHYKTGEVIPDALIAKIEKARNFNQGFSQVEYLASGLIDMKWHLLTEVNNLDIREQEQAWLKEIGMPREIIMRHRSPHFTHIFSNDYAAGYYSYLWAQVLDADAFEAFKEARNPFDPTVAGKLLKYIYSAGGSEDPMKLYESFRGRKPDPQALMRKMGFVN